MQDLINAIIPEFSITIENCFYVIVLILIPNIYFFNSKYSKRNKIAETTSSDIRVVPLIENFLRILIFGYPLFLSIKFESDLFIFGILIILTGLILYYSVWYAIFTTSLDEIVVKGPFKYSRHPGHLTPLIIFIGISIISLSFFYLIISFVFIFFHSLEAINEEKLEHKKFGEKYTEYASVTPRWIGLPKKQ
jgi:protein-S-isoprenylcysteine O-methyltransferase Ste14